MKHYYNEKYYENIELSYKIQAFDFVAYNKAIKVKWSKNAEASLSESLKVDLFTSILDLYLLKKPKYVQEELEI